MQIANVIIKNSKSKKLGWKITWQYLNEVFQRMRFCKSQNNYCPAIWMFHSRLLHKKIDRLHEPGLKVIYSDKQSHFEADQR